MERTIELDKVFVTINPKEKWVRTTFKDTLKWCLGTREDTKENRREAKDQGYKGRYMVWQSLLEHELLHNLVAEWIYDGISPALYTEAGHETPKLYYLRLEEESIVLAFQRFLNTGDVPHPLGPYLPFLDGWKGIFVKNLVQLSRDKE